MSRDEEYDPELDLTEEQLLEELDEEPVKLDENFENVLVIDNVPVVGEKKLAKLTSVLRKKIDASIDGATQSYDLSLPMDQTGNTLGYAFLEFDCGNLSNGFARTCAAKLNNVKLDKNHTLRVNLFDDFEKYRDVPEVFEMKADDYESKENTSSWLADGRAQYLVRHSNETEVWWNDPQLANENGRVLCNDGAEHKDKGKQWTELVADWSKKGSFLVTFHQQGIVLWGGDSFSRQGRFSHPGVRVIDFSPCENYLVTCNAQEAKKPGDPECIIVWDVRTGKKLRGFDGGAKADWPIFKWSHDDKYIARVGQDKKGQDVISVYEVPSMMLLDKKSIKVKNVKEIEWSPTANVLSYWVPELDNAPATVSLIEIPSKTRIREKHLYKVSDIKMFWQENGDYLAVRMVLHKTKKTKATKFEVFNMRHKNIPVESMEIDQRIVAFAWEPIGNRFAIAHTDERLTHVSVYWVNKKGGMKCVGTLTDRPINGLFWSPQGSYLVLASLGSGAGILECVDANTMYSLASREHFMCKDVEWDPTGRYVISSVTQHLMSRDMREKMENGYKVWSLDGKGAGLFVCTTSVNLDKNYQVLWRPRPPVLLSEEEKKDIEDNLKEKYWKRFDQEDARVRVSQMGEAEQKRLEMKDEWNAYRRARAAEYKEGQGRRAELRGGYESDNEEELTEVEEEVEVQISVQEEILGDFIEPED